MAPTTDSDTDAAQSRTRALVYDLGDKPIARAAVTILADTATPHVVADTLDHDPDPASLTLTRGDVLDALALQLPDAPQSQLMVALHHNYLPRLHDAGLIDYNTVDATIHITDPDAVVTLDEAYDLLDNLLTETE